MAFPGFRTIALASLTAVLSAGSLAAGQVVYPAMRQSAEQQKIDEAACHTWAVEQSVSLPRTVAPKSFTTSVMVTPYSIPTSSPS